MPPPVAAKADLVDGTRKLVNLGDVYFRTLASNGTPSTAPARPQDWRDVVEICFDNRELLRPHQRELGRCALSTGEQFLIIAGLVDDFDAGVFQRQFSPLPKSTSPGFIIEQPLADPDDLRGALLLPD
jgi:hypothetical protein